MTILEKILVLGLTTIVIAGSFERYQAGLVKEEVVRADIKFKQIVKALNYYYYVECLKFEKDSIPAGAPQGTTTDLINAGANPDIFKSPWSGTRFDYLTNIIWKNTSPANPTVVNPELIVSLSVTQLDDGKKALISNNNPPTSIQTTINGLGFVSESYIWALTPTAPQYSTTNYINALNDEYLQITASGDDRNC